MKSEGTDIKDVKNPVQFHLPSSNLFLLSLCVMKPRSWAALTLLGNLLLNPRNGPAIKHIIGEQSTLRTAGATHVVN